MPVALAAAAAAVTPSAASAQAGVTSYNRCDPAVPGASYVGVARASCADVEGVATAVAAASPAAEATVLQSRGWRPLRALPAGPASDDRHDIVAVRGRAALRVTREGVAPSLDGWAGGRELVFARSTIIGGKPIPSGAAFCTSAFLVRQRSGALGGISAAHCAGLRSDGTVQRRNVALRRPPQPGIVLGQVLQILTRRFPLDALLLPVPTGANRTANAVVDRGIRRPPLPVVGSARSLSGRRICFTGRTSGPDRCGRIRGSIARPLENLFALEGLVVRCTTITAHEGDSGGPVYTAPGSDGAVRAVGTVELITGAQSKMCFTPIAPVLDRLRVKLVTVPR